MDERYYILDVESVKRGDVMLWWKPNNAGYTARLDLAGWYTKEQIDAKPGYYNNGDETLAVPVSVAKLEAVNVVPSGRSVLARIKEVIALRTKAESTPPEAV